VRADKQIRIVRQVALDAAHLAHPERFPDQSPQASCRCSPHGAARALAPALHPALDQKIRNVAGKQRAVVRDQRGVVLKGGGRDEEIDVALRDPVSAERGLEIGEATRDRFGHGENADAGQLLRNASP
jgi:hypothetical protein